MLEKINNYINDRDFRFTVYEDKVHIMNFTRILVLEEDYISLQSTHKKITLHGSNLTLQKLLEKEILISGILTSLEVEND